ncbi:MAG TPA: MarR family winged helix-turn-helix transcriptional regulator [Chitinophagaceae bacterium]|nr:MarR family winged helix-turn-helix transcriptional regulator [Chitinophagaceae bacterium]
MIQKQVDEIRAFNRFYTRIIGLLDKYILDSSYTLPEVRILYEIYHHENIQAGEIVQTMDIDKGYLSRMLNNFVNKKLVAKKRSPADGRSVLLSLTLKGRKEFEALNAVQDDEIKAILAKLSGAECDKLLHHMDEIKKLLLKTGA